MVTSFLKRRAVGVLVVLLIKNSAWGCSVCMGPAGSPLMRGMNMGIFSLLAIIGLVLTSFAGFFIYLMRRDQQTEI